MKEILIIASAALFLLAIIFCMVFILRSKSQANPQAQAGSDRRITKLGLLFYGLMIFALLAGFIAKGIFPESWLGEHLSTRTGLFVYFGVVLGLFGTLDTLLPKMGVILLKPPKEKSITNPSDES